MRILVLGGTEEGRALSDHLVSMGHQVTTSFAGRTSDPMTPKGEIRIGGYGGALGLAEFLRSGSFRRVVDATHPYAVKVSAHAVHATRAANVQLVRIVRPGWDESKYDPWLHAGSVPDAASLLPRGARVLMTVGTTGLDTFFARTDCEFVVRAIEQPEIPLPRNAHVILSRPPYFPGGETELLQREAITHLVTKNSGGVQTEAKLGAAMELGIAVIMIARPKLLPATEVATVGRAIAALHLEAG